MPANFASFLSHMENLSHKFSVIALTETWLKQSNVFLYGMTGYNHIAITRSHGKGGGVSQLISDVFEYSELTEMCMVSDYIECIFVRIINNEFSSVICAIYRPPNSNIIMFNEKLNNILSQVSHMSCYIIGDYNIDLLKYGSHSQTDHFLDIMYWNSLFPMIYKLTRETSTCTAVTLIDNIFTNSYSIDNLLLQGLLIADISDHRAIFHIQDKYIPEKDQFQLTRLCIEQKMNDYKDSICNIDWPILDEYKTCEAYFSHFLKMFKSVYDKSFPVIKVKKTISKPSPLVIYRPQRINKM